MNAAPGPLPGEAALDWLLSPQLSSAEFLAKHWESSPAFIQRSQPDYFSSLLTVEQVDSVLMGTGPTYPSDSVRIVRVLEDEEVEELRPRPARDGMDAYELYERFSEGFSLVADRVETRWPAFSELCKRLREELCHPVGANLYITPGGVRAFPPHFDNHDVIVLQLVGNRAWNVWNPTPEQTLPLERDFVKLKRSELGPNDHRFELRRGDSLYLPRGFVHEGEAPSGLSVHLTINVVVVRWLSVLTDALRRAASTSSRFRRGLPVGVAAGGEGADEVLQHGLRDLLNDLSEEVLGGGFSGVVEAVTESHFTHGQPPLDGHFDALSRLNELGLESRMVRRAGLGCRLLVEEDRAGLAFPGNRLMGPAFLEPTFVYVAANREFLVEDLPGGLSDSAKLVLVRRMVREGLLRWSET